MTTVSRRKFGFDIPQEHRMVPTFHVRQNINGQSRIIGTVIGVKVNNKVYIGWSAVFRGFKNYKWIEDQPVKKMGRYYAFRNAEKMALTDLTTNPTPMKLYNRLNKKRVTVNSDTHERIRTSHTYLDWFERRCAAYFRVDPSDIVSLSR